jgi:hypothetical protein
LAAGLGLNTFVMVVNGAMPFATGSAQWAGFSAEVIAAPAYGHEPITARTELAVFADVVSLPELDAAVVSIGDLLRVVGVTWLLSQSALIDALAAPVSYGPKTWRGRLKIRSVTSGGRPSRARAGADTP